MNDKQKQMWDDAVIIYRLVSPARIAEEICSVQPMPANTFSELYKVSQTEQELIDNGFEPVDEQTKFMWVRKKKEQ